MIPSDVGKEFRLTDTACDRGNDAWHEAPTDLSLVLKRIMDWRYSTRSSKEARARLANDAVTRELLEAGLRLITGELKAGRRPATDDDPPVEASPFFDWLSVAKVVQEVGRSGRLRATDAQLRDRWKNRAHYVEDLLSYALWDRHWSLHEQAAQESRAGLMEGEDLVEEIHDASYKDMVALMDNRAYRLSLVASALAAGSPMIAQSNRDAYAYIGRTWSAVYADALAARGWRLRPDISLEEFTVILTSVADGIGFRLMFDDNELLIDHGRERSLLGKAALAMAAACIDFGDGMPLEQLVRQMTTSEQTGD